MALQFAGPILAGLLVLASASYAQMTPTRLYYGVGRSVPMEVRVPGEEGGAAIRLYAAPGSAAAAPGAPLAEAPVAPGLVDLATHFPRLWGEQDRRVLYAQLVVDGVEIGPPVVLQPMVTPEAAMLVDPGTLAPTLDAGVGVVMFEGARARALAERGGAGVPERAVVYAGVRAYVDRHVVLDTEMGEVEVRLRPDAAPNTAWNFRHLAEGGFYDDVVWHRVVPTSRVGAPFVIQAGDPTGGGEGGPGYSIDLEPSTLGHDFGVTSMARDSDPNTNGSQFFIALSREATARLDGRYTAFGEVVRGAEAIMSIARVELLPEEEGAAMPRNRPKDPPRIRRAYLVDAPPFGERPERVRSQQRDPGR